MSQKSYFNFKQFKISQNKSAMKVGIDGVLLGAWTNPPEEGRILDIGTGTGLLALMLAQRSNGIIDAIDIEANAVDEARKNKAESKWGNRINIYHSSFEDFVKSNDCQYDLVISNPPFFNENRSNISKERELARNRNKLNLVDLIRLGSQVLEKKGRISFIYAIENEEEIRIVCDKYGLYINRLLRIKPNPDKEFHRILVECSFLKTNYSVDELTIENKEHLNYTNEFIQLTKDYYLFF